MGNTTYDQLEKVRRSFYESPKTMKEVDKETGVMRENICRYCRTLRLEGSLFKVNRRKCRVTGHPLVWEWTTNPTLKPKEIQLRLFDF